MKSKAIGVFLSLTLAFGGFALAQGHNDIGPHNQGNNTPGNSAPAPRPSAPAPAPVAPGSPVNNIAPAFTEEWHDGNMLYRTYRSAELWSGEGKDFSGWYTLTSGPAPAGYRIADIKFRLVGDRACAAWAECAQVGQDASTVTWKFRMQGHDENKWMVFDYIGINNHNSQDGIHFRWEGRKATSVGVLTIGYAPTS